MKISARVFLISFLAFLFILAGCASSVSVKVQRPAELDLNGAKKISVVPFVCEKNLVPDLFDGRRRRSGREFFRELFFNAALYPFKNPELEKCSRYISDDLKSSIINSGYFEFIDSELVSKSLKDNSALPCEVYITGELTDYQVSVEDKKTEKISGDKKIITEEFSKKVELRIEYRIVDAENGTVFADETRTVYRTSGWFDRKRDLPSTMDIIRADLLEISTEILRKVKPYYVNRKVELLKNRSKDEKIKARMKLAKEYAESQMISSACKTYIECYQETGNFEAGYNGAMLLMQQDRFDEAEKIMSELYYLRGDKKTLKALTSIKREKEYKKKLEDQQKARDRKNPEPEENGGDFSSVI